MWHPFICSRGWASLLIALNGNMHEGNCLVVFHFCYKMERWEHVLLIFLFPWSTSFLQLECKANEFGVSKPNQSSEIRSKSCVCVCKMNLSILLNCNIWAKAVKLKWNTLITWCKEINLIKNDAHQFSSCFTLYSNKGPSRYLLTF